MNVATTAHAMDSLDVEQVIDWENLPSGLSDIRRIAGAPTAIALARSYGGHSVYIPRRVNEAHPLVALLGPEAVEALGSVYGGERINVPKADSILRQLRCRSIRAARRNGATVAALATEHGLTRRRVLQILASS